MAPKKQQPLPLSLKELKVLEFIEQFIEAQSVAPTFQEIKEHFGFASFNSVQRYLKQLQDKNYIHIPGGNQKRALQVLHSSRSASNSLQERITAPVAVPKPQYPSSPQPTLKKGFSEPISEALSLPLLGRVAAGAPIEAFTHDEYIDVPPSLVRNAGKTYALVVEGQSMIEDGILDGDIILVQRQTYANNGETVVAMVNNQATVKRFYLHRKRDPNIHSNPQVHAHPPPEDSPQVELRPANSSMESMWHNPQKVDIQGLVVGLMRRF
jgi:repressor LexA